MTPAEQVVLEALAEEPHPRLFFESAAWLFIEMPNGSLAYARKFGTRSQRIARALAQWIGCLCLVLLSSVAWADSEPWVFFHCVNAETGQALETPDGFCPAGYNLRHIDDVPNPDAPEVIASTGDPVEDLSGLAFDASVPLAPERINFEGDKIEIHSQGESLTIACRNSENNAAKCLMRMGRKLARLKKRCAGVEKIDPQPKTIDMPATFIGGAADIPNVLDPNPDEHCFDVNCRITNKAECQGDCDAGTGFCYTTSMTPPCKTVCDQFCVNGTIKKTEAQ